MLVFEVIYLCSFLHAFLCQDTDIPKFKSTTGDEASVLVSMLEIVDKKFNTLSSRITTLESAINSLQFYNLRQFKIMNTNLVSVNTFMQGIHGKMTELNSDSRGMKIAVDILDQDITGYTESNRQIMEDMNKGMTAIDKSVHENSDRLIDRIQTTETLIVKVISNNNRTSGGDDKDKLNTNCVLNTTVLQDHVDGQMAQLRTAADQQLQQLKFINHTVALLQQNDPKPTEFKEHYNKINAFQTNKEENANYLKCNTLENEKLLKALKNFTGNLVQSVSHLRHTGGLFEEIVTNTDSLAKEQVNIRGELGKLNLRLDGMNNFTYTPFNVSQSHVTQREKPLSEPQLLLKSSKYSKGEDSSAEKTCPYSLNDFKTIFMTFKNESVLLAGVGHLLLNTSMAISKTLVDLQDKISSLKEMAARNSIESNQKPKFHDTNILHQIANQTRQSLRMVKIIASNTGWLPHTFQRVGSVSEQINKSLVVSTDLYESFSKIFDIKNMPERNSQHVSQSSSNKRAELAYGEHDLHKTNLTSVASSPLLNLIFNTNKQLKRIMPALTRLIAEPEPLFTLVNGERDNEGRLEVYYQGQWGTMCGQNLNNNEASILCRNLGYFGGVASSRGSFGAGNGGFWAFNKTCIKSKRCPVLESRTELARCNHAEDIGLICDHMVRVVDNDGFISRSRGRLQLYHSGRWRPVCSRGWKESEIRTACRQLGYNNGRMINGGEVKRGPDNLFIANILCEKENDILHTCNNKHWMVSKCSGYLPVALACL